MLVDPVGKLETLISLNLLSNAYNIVLSINAEGISIGTFDISVVTWFNKSSILTYITKVM